MPNVTATIRFGSRAVGRAFRLTAGSSVDVTAEFRDDDGALVDVSGVTLTATRPGGAAYTWTEGTLTEVSAGIWQRRLTPPEAETGMWLVEAGCTDPQPETAAGYVQVLVPGDLTLAGTPVPVPPAGIPAGSIADSTDIGRALLTAASSAAARTTLALGGMATQSAASVAITGGALNGVAIGGTTPATEMVATYAVNGVAGAQVVYNFGAGSPDSYTKGPLHYRCRWQGTITGTATGTNGQLGMYKLLGSDAAYSQTEQVNALLVNLSAQGNATAGDHGSRRAATFALQVSGTYGDAVGGDYIIFEPGQAILEVTANQGGTGGWPGGSTNPTAPYYRGAGFAWHFLALFKNGATNLRRIYGIEIAIAVQTGSSVGSKFGLHIGRDTTDAVRADLNEEGALLLSGSSGGGWFHGLQFGERGNTENWPIASTGTMIGIVGQEWPTAKTRADRTAAYGVDLREATFSAAAFASNGFSVDDAGNIKSAGLLARNYINDAAAAAGGVPIEGLYHNNGAVRVRRT
jgi:hypothetical protein